jgi:predicted membrane channel-forming protein YqfA (hemolysin III family)
MSERSWDRWIVPKNPSDMGNAPWYLRVSAGFVLLVGMAQFVEWFSSATVPLNDRSSIPPLIAGSILTLVGAAIIAGHRWAYPVIVLIAVIAVVAGVALTIGDQGVPPGSAAVGISLAASGVIVLATAATPRSIRWARGRTGSDALPS